MHLIGPFQQHFKEKTFPFGEEESTFTSRQHGPSTDSQIQRILLRIAFLSSIFTFCDYFLLFPNLKKWFGGKIHQRAAHRRNKRLILKGWTNHIIRTA